MGEIPLKNTCMILWELIIYSCLNRVDGTTEISLAGFSSTHRYPITSSSIGGSRPSYSGTNRIPQ